MDCQVGYQRNKLRERGGKKEEREEGGGRTKEKGSVLIPKNMIVTQISIPDHHSNIVHSFMPIKRRIKGKIDDFSPLSYPAPPFSSDLLNRKILQLLLTNSSPFAQERFVTFAVLSHLNVS